MPTFYDSQGQSYALTNQIGRGGEGTVFVCPNDLTLVAKIYHEPIDAEKAEKLRWMAEHKNDQLLKVAAWIVDTLHDAPSGKVVGFLMPNVKAKEIHELYSLKSRRVHFPEATWQFLVHTATNVARAFYNLHKNNHVMGDVNHGNCVVLRDGTVKMIDCDSYSISTGDFRYRCEVGVATHLAPELQGVDLGEVERIPMHDNFGLAVIVFQLLFLGRHPFAGNYLGDEDKSLEDCIRERRFAYGADAHLWRVKQPPGTLSLSAVTPRLATMFERAFLTDDRPEPREWIEALEDLSESLKQCSLHIGHFYFEELRTCPWCELETQTGLMLFPFVSGNRSAGDEQFNIFTIENLVSSLAVPQNLPAKPPKPIALPPPSPEAETTRRQNLSRFIMLAILQFCIVVFLTAIAGAGVGFFVGAILMTGLIVTLNNSGKTNKSDLEARLEKARQDWNQLENEWSAADTAPQFNSDLSLIKEKISEHQTLQQQGREKVKLLHDEVFHDKFDVYLSSFKIGDAQIAGLGLKNLDLLKGYGIRTAADVDAKRLNSLPPIDGEIKTKVIEWRKNLERNFVYDPDTEIPEGEQKRLSGDFAEKRSRIEREIESLLVGLRSSSTVLYQRQQHLSARAAAVAQKLVQSESDLSAVGNITPPIVVLILITTLIPMFGNAFSGARPYQSSPRDNASRTVTASNTSNRGSGYGNSSSNTGGTNVYAYTVPDNLTDKDIANLTEAQKSSGAQQLLERAAKIVSDEKNYKKAEQRLQLAIKLVPNDTRILNKLGDVLYEQKEYKISLIYLNRSLLLDSNNADTKFAIGLDYLKMSYFEDARRMFGDITKDSPRSFEAQFNLGQAYKGLNQYYSAVSSFRTAVDIKPGDTDAHYEYAVSLNKIGSADDVLKEYEKLYDLDPKVADKLRKDLGLKNVPVINRATINQGSGGGTGSGDGVGNGRGGGTGSN
jgi:DNA-binding helix-hairpin-helix protein with protein kinase domain/Tfp pilus assembly protein PilF